MNGVPSFQDFLADLLGCFIKDPQMVADIKERLCAILSNLKTQATQGVDIYVSKHLIPDLSRLIQSSCGVSAEKQLKSLKPFIVIGLETFLQNGRVLNKDEIIQLAKNTLPGLIIETLAFPDASESTNKTAAKIVAATTNMFFDTGLSPTQSYENFVKDVKNSLCEAVLPELKEQLMSAMDRFLDYIENEPDIKDNATSFMNLLVQVLTPYLPTEFLQCLESIFEDTVKTMKLSSRKIIKKTVKRNSDRVTSKIQEASPNDLHHFVDFLTELLRCFFNDLVDEIKTELRAILSNMKTQTTQGVDRYVSKHLIPDLSRLIQYSCGVSAEKQLKSLKPFIIIGLKTFLEKGRVLNKEEIIQLAKNTLPELITETLAFPYASESTNKTAAKIVAATTNMFFDTGLSPTQSYEDFVKDLKDSLCEAVLPELKKQLMSAMDRFLDYIENEPDIKDNATSFMNLLVQVLTPYLPTEFLQCLESTFEDTVKTMKRSSRKIIKKTVNKIADRVTSKIQEASPNDLHHFVDFLTELLRCFFNDLVDEIKTELRAILSNMKTQATQGVDKYVSKYLIPELSRLIQSSFCVSAEKQLMSLKPFIIKGLETFLKKGRVLNKDEIIQLAKKSVPELIIQTAIPNANENTKTLISNTLNSVQEAVFNLRPGTTPSVEKLLKTLLENCADKVFCIDRDRLSQAIDKLIELMPENVDKIMEFLVKHVFPALSVCFEATAFDLVAVFLRECFERLRKEGTVTVRGRDLAKPLAMKVLNLASTKGIKNAAEVSTVVTETVVKRKVTHKIVQKCVIDKAGGKVAVETTKKVAAKTSKSVVAKVTQNASLKAVSTGSQVTAKQGSVKVGMKAVKTLSGKASHKGVQVAGKTVQKASVKMTKNIGDGITNGVTEVTKKSVKKTVKATLSETAEKVTVTTTKKVTKTSVSKTTNICQTSSKAASKVGMKNAATAGATAAGISALVGGVFLYCDLKNLDEKKKKGSLTEKEYKEQKVERIGEYTGDVIGSGVVGVAVSVAALTGPAGWAAIGVGALLSFASGKLGGQIAKALV